MASSPTLLTKEGCWAQARGRHRRRPGPTVGAVRQLPCTDMAAIQQTTWLISPHTHISHHIAGHLTSKCVGTHIPLPCTITVPTVPTVPYMPECFEICSQHGRLSARFFCVLHAILTDRGKYHHAQTPIVTW